MGNMPPSPTLGRVVAEYAFDANGRLLFKAVRQ